MILHDKICDLPVMAIADELVAALEKRSVSILKAPPGSGKSTALTALLVEKNICSGKKIIMLEPRRIACRMTAERIAFLLDCKVGGLVGYRMRGEKKIGPDTVLEIVTEGLFTRMIQHDMELSDYALVIFDEFHERNIHSDLGLALSLDVRKNLRSDLGILIMSATLNADELKGFLPQGRFFECEGTLFPTRTVYSAGKIPCSEVVQSAYYLVREILQNTEKGNILIFMPGAYEILQLNSMLEKDHIDNLITAPLFGALSKDMQQKALATPPDGCRKAVIATNIAESSVTIDDIQIVIDSGWEKKLYFNPGSGMNKLEMQRIAKSSAIQRGGRAGRTSAGTVYRLYTRHEFEGMSEYPVPEIGCVDLANFCIELALWGCNADELDFLTPPSDGSLLQAEQLLYELALTDKSGRITADGRAVGNFPGSCRVGKMFLEAEKKDLAVLACEAAAMLDEKVLPSANLQQSLEILRKYPTPSYKRMLDLLLKEQRLSYRREDSDRLGELLFSAYPDRVGKRRANKRNEYQLSNGRGAYLLSGIEGAEGEYIIAPLLDKGEEMARISAAASFSDISLLYEKSTSSVESSFDMERGTFIREHVISFRKMVLERKPCSEFDAAAFKDAVLNLCRKRGLGAVFNLEADDINFINRCRFAHFAMPEKYDDLSEKILLADGSFIDYLDGSIRSLAALKKVKFRDLLSGFIGYDVCCLLDREFPEKYLTPGGSNYKIRYEENDAVLSVPIAEMYGTSTHPVTGIGRFPLKIELLSPAMRPVQITRDLPEFWRTNWVYVQKEMKQRYIKHFWPDDPANALPGRSIRKKQP